METIGTIIGIVVFILAIGAFATIRSLIKLVKYFIKAYEDKNISKEEEKKLIELLKVFGGNVLKTISKCLTTKIDKNKDVKDIISKLKK